jgi:hypothetical protein
MTRKNLYIASLTWGLPITICGLFAAAYLLATGHKPYRHAGCWCFEVGKSDWGGLNLGLVILCQPNIPASLKNHEFGHAIQNCRFGFIMPIFVLCSVIRYHRINYLERRGLPIPRYDDWWFEGQATSLGEKFYKQFITK